MTVTRLEGGGVAVRDGFALLVKGDGSPPRQLAFGSTTDRLNVRWYGAVGDGVTDDAPAIRACRQAAKSLGIAWYLPAGTYLLASFDENAAHHQFFIPYSNETIYGDGTTSILKAGPGLIVAGAGWNGFRTNEPISCTGDAVFDTFTATAHGYSDGQRIAISDAGTGTLPSHLSKGQRLYAINVAANTFQVASSPTGTALTLGSNGSGLKTAAFIENFSASGFKWDGNSSANPYPSPWGLVTDYENSGFYMHFCSNVHIVDVGFDNMSGSQPTQLGTQFDALSSEDIWVERCRFYNVMDDANKAVAGDQSCIGVNGVRVHINSNSCINPTTNTTARRISTFIEVHGSNMEIIGNHCARMSVGLNLAGSFERLPQIHVASNNFGDCVAGQGVRTGIAIWNLTPATNLEGLQVVHNNVYFESNGTGLGEYGIQVGVGAGITQNGQTLANAIIAGNNCICTDANPVAPFGISLRINMSSVLITGNRVVGCRTADGAHGVGIDLGPTSLYCSRTITNVNTSTDTLTKDLAQDYPLGTPVTFATIGGTLFSVNGTPVVPATTYYVVSPSGATLKIAATAGGAALDITAAGSGTIIMKHLQGNLAQDVKLYNNEAVNSGGSGFLISTFDEPQGITFSRLAFHNCQSSDNATVPLMLYGIQLAGHVDDVTFQGCQTRGFTTSAIGINLSLGTPTNIRYIDGANTTVQFAAHNITVEYDGIQANDTVPAFTSVNNAAATAIVPFQYSPSSYWTGQAWNTSALASQTVGVGVQLVAASGNPVNGFAEWRAYINGGDKAFRRDGVSVTYSLLQVPSGGPSSGFYFDSSADAGMGFIWNANATGSLDMQVNGSTKLKVTANGTALTNGTPLKKYLSVEHSLSFGSIGAGATAELTIALTGAVATDMATASPEADPGSSFMWSARAGADVVTVRVANVTGAGATPSTINWRVAVWQH